MLVLILNSGSSSLKFDLVDVTGGRTRAAHPKLAHGVVDRIGGDATFEFHTSSEQSPEPRRVTAPGHREAVTLALAAIESLAAGKIDAVGHRVVHGGDRFVAPTLIDDSVIRAIRKLCELAPLHNPPALEGITAAREALGPAVPMVAVFDTAFHSTLPDYAYAYALPHETARRHKIRRYGFHGTAHEYMLRQYAHIKGIAPGEANIITLQLGNGCSAAAIRDGKSVDTSMGFTPLEGLVMGTRSGDLDPALVAYLAEKEHLSAAQVIELLNERSGLLGVSGSASDMRSLLTSMQKGDKRATLAVELFCYRVRKYVGAYLAALGGAHAIVFGGGIGENSPYIRAHVLSGMDWCGIKLDKEHNEATVGKEGEISTSASPIAVYVVPVDESLLIAEHTANVVRSA